MRFSFALLVMVLASLSRRRTQGSATNLGPPPDGGDSSALAPLARWSISFDDLDDAAGADGAAALADREPQPLVHGDGVDQRDLHLGVVARHAHLHPLGELDMAGDVRRPKIELGPVVRKERLVPAALLLRPHRHTRHDPAAQP